VLSSVNLKYMRLFTLALTFLAVGCGCITFRGQILAQESELRRRMQDETVKLEINVAVTVPASVSFLGPLTSSEEKGGVVQFACSGVVVEHSGGIVNKPTSVIVTANHCLDYKPGQVMEDGSIVQAVMVTAMDSNGKSCGLETTKLGGMESDDVATGVADCHLGKVARLADAVPDRQSVVYISGHPLGVFPGLISIQQRRRSHWVTG
jgi:hypothetical protein